MFFHTPTDRPKYMKVTIKYFPEDIQDKYNFDVLLLSNGNIYIQNKKGMYELKQAALLAYQFLSNFSLKILIDSFLIIFIPIFFKAGISSRPS